MQSTPQEQGEELVEAFDTFDSWEDRYRFLIDLGRELGSLPPEEKNEDTRITGCQSNVWLVAGEEERDGGKVLRFRADSDSIIVRGLVTILIKVYDNQPPRAILNYDVNELMQRLGLDQHLTIGRRNGMAGMAMRIKSLAAQAQTSEAAQSTSH